MKKCKQGYYYCYDEKKCKKIPTGYRVGLGGWLRKEKEEEKSEDNGETETKKNGNGSNGNGEAVSEGWSEKYKKSIDCKNPKGFSQKAHCQGRKVNEAKEQEKDHEVSMAKTQVKKSIDNLQKVARVLAKKSDADNLPAWVQAKLTDTEHNTDAAASYMTGKEDLDEGKRDGKSAKDKDYSLRDWFKGGGWVQAGGKYDGKPCAKQPGQKTKPFCRDADDRAAMSKEERNKRAKKKRKEDPNPNRKGKAKIVTAEAYDTTGTKYAKEKNPVDAALGSAVERQKLGGTVIPKMPVKMADSYSNWRMDLEQLDEFLGGVPGDGYIGHPNLNIKNPLAKKQNKKPVIPGSQGGGMVNRVGGQIGDVRMRQNAEIEKLLRQSYEIEGEVVSEKKDACYKKVKARYDVWPSAYASGALVKCRKVGAANWGNKTKKEGYEFSNWRDDFQPIEIETTDLIKPEPLISEQQANSQKDQQGMLGKSVGYDKPETNLQRANRELTTIRRLKQKTGLNVGTTTSNNASYSDGNVSTNAFESKDPCWDGYKQVGMKKKGGKMVPNCVKEGYSNWREELSEDWQKVNKGDKTDGMSQKAVDAYRRENPGSKLKTAVTEKKPKGKRAKRRKSFCARSKGQQDMHNIDCSKTPDKAICKARRRWRC